jgi:hypothetical protein
MGILGVFDNSVCQSCRFTYCWPEDFYGRSVFFIRDIFASRELCKIMVYL